MKYTFPHFLRLCVIGRGSESSKRRKSVASNRSSERAAPGCSNELNAAATQSSSPKDVVQASIPKIVSQASTPKMATKASFPERVSPKISNSGNSYGPQKCITESSCPELAKGTDDSSSGPAELLSKEAMAEFRYLEEYSIWEPFSYNETLQKRGIDAAEFVTAFPSLLHAAEVAGHFIYFYNCHLTLYSTDGRLYPVVISKAEGKIRFTVCCSVAGISQGNFFFEIYGDCPCNMEDFFERNAWYRPKSFDYVLSKDSSFLL